MNPLSALYGGAVSLRNFLHDRGALRAQRLAAPVISVGSVSAGGAGKTPFVLMLGTMLQKRGITFDVLSRGYGRKTRGVRIVDGAGSAAEFGDEPMLIARRLGCPVVVGESRYQAGRLAEREFGSELHILDDGFQHRSLARDFDIALLTAPDVSDRLLPVGRLREPLSSLQRADVIAAAEDAPLNQMIFPQSSIWRFRRRIELPAIVLARPVVFCGIARPQSFLEQIRKAGVAVAAFESYRDHHAYSREDIRKLTAVRDQNHADGFITTEKDAVNLGALISDLGQVAVAKVEMEIIDPPDALDTMLRRIGERQRKA